jgi:trk system potassium uptake protein TrkA
MRSSHPPSGRRYAIVVGCGRLGSHLANTFSARGNSVVVIDREPAAFEQLSADFSGFTVEGDAAEFAVLEQAKTADADLFIAVTSRDNLNIFAGQVARFHFKVPEVIVRVFEPELESFYNLLGLRTVCPTTISADYFLKQP